MSNDTHVGLSQSGHRTVPELGGDEIPVPQNSAQILALLSSFQEAGQSAVGEVLAILRPPVGAIDASAISNSMWHIRHTGPSSGSKAGDLGSEAWRDSFCSLSVP